MSTSDPADAAPSGSNREITRPRYPTPLGLRPQHAQPVLLLAGRADDHEGKRVRRAGPRLWRVDRELELGREPHQAPAYVATALEDDKLLSRRHAQLRLGPATQWWLRDLGSTNGTTVDDVLVPAGSAAPLANGSVIGVGAHVFVFRQLVEAEIEVIVRDGHGAWPMLPTLAAPMARIQQRLERIAPTATDVLLTGETGVGKEVCARALHAASGRPGPFVAINCATLPDHLVESELFGYARGAHSTADAAKPGLIEAAHRGTLFLDEIGEMSGAAQSKLLRFLQDHTLTSLGTTLSRELDVRVVAATNRQTDPTGGIAGLRDDLVARLGPEPFRLPPLRERIEDLGTLTSHFVGQTRRCFDPDAHYALFRHRWRGNVRELEKTIQLACATTEDGEVIGFEHLPSVMAIRQGVPTAGQAASPDTEPRRVPPPATRMLRATPTRGELATLLDRHGGNVADVARELGRQRTLVWRWLRQHGLRPERSIGDDKA